MILSICQPLLDQRFRTSLESIQEKKLKPNGYKHIENQSFLKRETSKNENTPGGSSLNTLRTISDKTSIKTAFIGAIGNDKNGDILLDKIKNENTKCLFQRLETSTGFCHVLLNNNERSMVTYSGAANKLTLEFIKANYFNVKNAKYVYICGFFMLSMPENAEWVLNNFKHSNIIFNLSNDDVIKKIDTKLLKKTINDSIVIIGNKNEFSALADILKIKFTDYEMCQLSVNKNLFVTNGNNPIYSFSNMKMNIYDVCDIGSDLDTCGAGDYFAAGAISGIYEDKTIEECVLLGNKWARESIIHNTEAMKNNIILQVL